MTQPQHPDDFECDDDRPGSDRGTLLDAYWDALNGRSQFESHRFVDEDSPDDSIAGDFDVLDLLHRLQFARGAWGGSPASPDAVFSRSSTTSVDSPLTTTGTAARCPREDRPEVAQLPARIGKYLVVELLDRGGQAEVFRVIHPELATEYALKLARRAMAVDDQVDGDSLKDEARILAQCEHQNLVRVVDLDVYERRRFVVMDYVKGKTLRQLVAGGRPHPRQAARLVIELAQAVAYLHDRGITHQDIKPQNVLVDDRHRPRLIDLGMARQNHAWRDDADDSTGGTAGYMSPEQASGCAELIGPRTDIFGLGALLYHLLTGRPLYLGSSRAATFQLARKAEYIPIRKLNPEVPRSLERICDKALAADPEDRYLTAVELERALRHSLERRWIAGACLLVLLFMAALATVSRPAPSIAPKVLSFVVEHFRGDPAVWLGPIGGNQTVQFDDDVRVSAKFDTPAYCYLIALNADGRVQLWDPVESERPARKPLIRAPSGASEYIALNDAVGEQAFVIVAATRPLPSFDRWEGKAGLDHRWKPASAEGAWGYDGHWIRRIDSGTRGEPRRRGGPPRAFEDVCDYLKHLPSVEAIQAIAFPVKPKTRIEKDTGDRCEE